MRYIFVLYKLIMIGNKHWHENEALIQIPIF